MAKVRQISAAAAADLVKDGMSVMVGGFMTCGTPEDLVDAIVNKGVKDLTIICNDAGYPDKGVGKLIANGQVKTVIASHVGLNPECGRLYSAGELGLILVPQGTLAERIRCAGAGLGGFLTPTGVGTSVAEGKDIITVDGVEFLLEKPLKADVALLSGNLVDRAGNIKYRGVTRNFNPIMATAAQTVIVQADSIAQPGAIGPEHVETPGIFIDYIVGGGK